MKPELFVESNGTQSWWLNDKLHREDGPAIIYANGTQKWFLNDEEIDPLVFLLKMHERAKEVA